MQQKIIKTSVFPFRFDLSRPEEKMRYLALSKALQEERGRPPCVTSLVPSTEWIEFKEGEILWLDLAYVFHNQWNSTGGKRVFDWREIRWVNDPYSNIKAGYWLELTEEMRQARREQYVCGYCGARYWNTAGEFCTKCLDSKFLKATELYLLRLRPAGENPFRHSRPSLTDEERKMLLPLYEAGQQKKREKKKQNKIAAARKKIEEAETELAYVLWLADNGFDDDDNWLYYHHRATACFGWRTPLKPEEAKVLDRRLQATGTVPFVYEIKTTEGVLY